MDLYEMCLKNIANRDIGWGEEQTQLPDESCSANSTLPANTIRPADVPLCCQKYLYISDLHLEYQITSKFPNRATNNQVKHYIAEIAVELVQSIPLHPEPYFFPQPILFGGDVSDTFEISAIFYRAFVKELSKRDTKAFVVYAILGNHEFWGFQSVEQCVDCYRRLFSELGIHFLQNTPEWVPPYRSPKQFVRNGYGYWECKEINPDENPKEYNRMLPHMHNTIILGGVGFAGRNPIFNAENGLYKTALNRAQEVLETEKWNETYEKILAVARKNNSVLVVLTHNPITDWKESSTLDGNCVYFCGHTHRARRQCEWERCAFYFADNQIGYSRGKIQFKAASIYTRTNPFTGFSDGLFSVSSADYVRFNDYVGEEMTGNGVVDRHIQMYGGRMIAIKRDGFYGFFLVSTKGTYICSGGRITKVSDTPEIDKYYSNFGAIVKKYIEIVSPYRSVQERISAEVKKVGGSGIIHGCIVDIDFTNHIQVDPYNGKLKFYHSPSMGIMKSYDSLMQLLEEKNPVLFENAKMLLDFGSSELLSLRVQSYSNMYEKIDIANSMYAVSNKINQIQRLFDRKVLRAWDDNILAYEASDEAPLVANPGQRLPNCKNSSG